MGALVSERAESFGTAGCLRDGTGPGMRSMKKGFGEEVVFKVALRE